MHARRAFVMHWRARQLIFLSKSSTRSLPEIKILRKIARTGNKSCIKYSSLSRKFVRWSILIFCMQAVFGISYLKQKFEKNYPAEIFSYLATTFLEITWFQLDRFSCAFQIEKKKLIGHRISFKGSFQRLCCCHGNVYDVISTLNVLPDNSLV